MKVWDNGIKFCLALVCVLLGTLACAKSLPEPPARPPSTQSSPSQQTPVQEPPNPPSSSAHSPIQLPQPVQPSVQPPSPPPVQKPVQPPQPSGQKPLNFPAYLLTEPQGTPSPNNNTSNNNNDINNSLVPVGPLYVQVLTLINTSRIANGFAQVERNSFLDALAQQHCQDMVKSNVLSHDGFDVRANTIIKTLGAHTVGENVAKGYDTAASLVQGWLNSPGHRENIMNPSFRRTGIGIAGNFATQIFSD
jgi:uncharacterized protein YkwD